MKRSGDIHTCIAGAMNEVEKEVIHRWEWVQRKNEMERMLYIDWSQNGKGRILKGYETNWILKKRWPRGNQKCRCRGMIHSCPCCSLCILSCTPSRSRRWQGTMTTPTPSTLTKATVQVSFSRTDEAEHLVGLCSLITLSCIYLVVSLSFISWVTPSCAYLVVS